MTTAYDVPPDLLIDRLAKYLKEEAKIEPPEWAAFAKTGVHTEKSPADPDWWYRRAASILRKTYLKGPVGSSRTAAEYGGRRDDGSAPYHPRKGSRAIVRHAFKQLEQLGYVASVEKRGRVVSSKGRELLDNISHQIMLELSAKNPELTKYLKAK